MARSKGRYHGAQMHPKCPSSGSQGPDEGVASEHTPPGGLEMTRLRTDICFLVWTFSLDRFNTDYVAGHEDWLGDF